MFYESFSFLLWPRYLIYCIQEEINLFWFLWTSYIDVGPMIMSGDGAHPQICLNNVYNGYDLFDLMLFYFLVKIS